MGNIIVRFYVSIIHFFVGINGVIKPNLVEDNELKVPYGHSPAFYLSIPFLSGKRYR